MPDVPRISETKRALLEKYLRVDLLQSVTTAARGQGGTASLSSTDSRAPLVAIQANGSKWPFFYAHTHWVGGAFYAFTLAHSLGVNQPFYLLDPYRFDGLQVVPTLETMAAAYIASMRAVQPEGPYRLGGFCGGGLVALEMAQQLQAAGQEVDLLVLIEPGAGPIQFTRMVGRCIRRIGKLIRMGPDKQLDCFLRIRHMYRLLKYEEDEKMERLSFTASAKALRQDWMGLFVWSFSQYPPRLYPGKVAFFWAANDTKRRKMWPKVVKTRGEGEVYVIPGTHMGLVTDQLHLLSAQLRVCLDKVQAATLS